MSDSLSTPPPMTFAGHLADVETAIVSNKFTTDLWIPEFGWNEEEEEEAAQTPFPAQMLAALQILMNLFVATALRTWVHLAAEMQAGKTGVITALIRLILANRTKLGIRPDRIFVVTGMNDKAWLKQTKKRLPSAVRNGVYHNSTLAKFGKKLHLLAGGNYLSNVVVFVDESHIASAAKNQPNKHIYQTLATLCPRHLWQERNIRIVTISATDPAKVMAVDEAEMPCAVVRLQTTSDYQSIEKLNEQGRIRFLEIFGDVMSQKGSTEVRRLLANEFKDTPLYHLIRARQGKAAEMEAFLKREFPDANVMRYDAETKAAATASAADDDSTNSSENMNDINDILSEPPAKTTFVILKNMFYAAKTLDDSHVGILWDRIGSKDDTNLQSLLGRSCGYGKSSRTVIYASRQTVTNYLAFWKELCSNAKMDRVLDVPATKVDKKMPGVKASHVSAGVSRLTTTSTAATPLGVGIAFDSSAGPATNRASANEDDFTSSWRKFSSFAEAKASAPRSRASLNAAGFYECSTTGKKQVLREAEILALKQGKKTANMHWKDLNVGDSHSRLYVCYRDTNDASTAQFWVRTIKRVK